MRAAEHLAEPLQRQLRAVGDFGARDEPFEQAQPLRAVDEDGTVKRTADGTSDQTLSDIYLRNEFPPPGKSKAPRPGNLSREIRRSYRNPRR